MKALAVAVIITVIAQPVVSPASGWLWPILGFHDYCACLPPPSHKPLPGTPGWQNYPGSSHAVMAPPGVAYYPINGTLNFGLAPPLGLQPPSKPAEARAGEAAGEKGAPPEENTTEGIPLSDFITGNMTLILE